MNVPLCVSYAATLEKSWLSFLKFHPLSYPRSVQWERIYSLEWCRRSFAICIIYSSKLLQLWQDHLSMICKRLIALEMVLKTSSGSAIVDGSISCICSWNGAPSLSRSPLLSMLPGSLPYRMMNKLTMEQVAEYHCIAQQALVFLFMELYFCYFDHKSDFSLAWRVLGPWRKTRSLIFSISGPLFPSYECNTPYTHTQKKK